jgi:hypothetical protein
VYLFGTNDYIIEFRYIVAFPPDVVLCDAGIPYFDAFLQDFIKIVFALDHKGKMIAVIAFGADGNTIDHEVKQAKKSHTGRYDIHAGSDGKSYAGRHPDACSRGQAFDIAADLYNNAGAEEGNTRNRLSGDSGIRSLFNVNISFSSV